MKFTVLSLFPEITNAYFASSIMAKALDKGIIEYQAVNIRDFALDKHKTCDDAPYGGGPGMLMLAEPLSRALESVGALKKVSVTVLEGEDSPSPGNVTGLPSLLGASAPKPPAESSGTVAGFGVAENAEGGWSVGAPKNDRGATENKSGNRHPYDFCSKQEICRGYAVKHPDQNALTGSGASIGRPYIIYLSPSGRPFDQKRAEELAAMDKLVLVCGRYEGIDERVIDAYVDEELSVGDYVLSSGEAAALVVIDAVYRLVDRVITRESLDEESFSGGLLEYPQYTRPEVFDMMKVPEVLLSGHHENIRKWRLKMRVEKTRAVRPELLERGLRDGLFDAETVKLIEEGKA